MSRDAYTDLLIVKGAISELPPELKQRLDKTAEEIRASIKGASSGVGLMAMALVLGEIVVEKEKLQNGQ